MTDTLFTIGVKLVFWLAETCLRHGGLDEDGLRDLHSIATAFSVSRSAREVRRLDDGSTA